MRISATLIDQYRLFMLDEYVTEQDLIDSIKGVWRPNRKVLCGQSFDSIIHAPEKYRKGDVHECDGISWPAEVMDTECLSQFTTSGTWQCKEVRAYILHDTPVNVVSKVDRLVADSIEEVKTRWSTFDYEKYYAAHQWRHYLLNFGASKIRYKVFCWTEPASGPFKLHGVEVFDLYPYDGMEAECLELLSGLVSYIHRKNLKSYVADDHPRLLRSA